MPKPKKKAAVPPRQRDGPGAAKWRRCWLRPTTWQTIQTLTLLNGNGLFTDDSPATLPSRYYRLVVP